ncbi:MAG TPA: type IV secretory system conjugative DNA transfer family protein [Candidatus Saccharimonadales bacterium]|nr:type IV secretory system conjugative DNA transfer family protein [Candidatus Saccharimonadales bacterium]
MALLGRRKIVEAAHDHILLMLEVPRTNDKKELAAEQMLAALHGILRPKKELKLSGTLQEHISLEVVAIGQRIRFYIWTPKHLQAFVEGQIYAQYPTVHIYEQDHDYADRHLRQTVVHSAELTLSDNETIPIKTFPSFEVDPLAAITATLAKLDKEDEEMWIQIMARPIPDDWHRKAAKVVSRIRNRQGILSGGSGELVSYAAQAFAALARPPVPGEGGKTETELSERDKSRIAAIEQKSTKLGYQVKVRFLYAGHDQHTARLRMQALVGAFKQFNTTNLNGFSAKGASFDRDKQLEYQTRFFIDSGYILNIEELASLFHLPHTSVETPNIVWATVKTAEPPANVPIAQPGHESAISLFGVTNFRGDNTIFGIYRGDRGRHVYILGQTGTGKTGSLELLTLSDIYWNQGFAVIDPHGDYAQSVLKFIPERRLEDVVYFNPADREFPIGFNPLEVIDPTLKGHISSEMVGVLKRLFADSWGPRLEYILRYTLLALLDYPDSTLLDITRMLTEKPFRQEVISHIDDPVVRNFWVNEFAAWNDKFATEAIAPVLNKVGAFTANPMVRNIIGQPKSTFNIRQIMDEGKILIVNLSRGLLGEDNAGILGAMMVTKIQLAAMSRADVPEHERRQFYLYVDEFQNFATDSFAVILSEARKYALNLTIANQYIAQMEQPVRDAVFGNVGTIVSFRVSPDDSPFLQKYFEPQFESADLIQQHNRHFVVSMTIEGEKAPAFSAKTLNLPQPVEDLTPRIVEQSRRLYSRQRADIEKIIHTAANKASAYSGQQNKPQNQPQKPPQPTKPQTKPVNNEKAGKAAAGLLRSLSPNTRPETPAKKRRRRRSRRKSTADMQHQAAVNQHSPQAVSDQEHTIRLR